MILVLCVNINLLIKQWLRIYIHFASFYVPLSNWLKIQSCFSLHSSVYVQSLVDLHKSSWMWLRFNVIVLYAKKRNITQLPAVSREELVSIFDTRRCSSLPATESWPQARTKSTFYTLIQEPGSRATGLRVATRLWVRCPLWSLFIYTLYII